MVLGRVTRLGLPIVIQIDEQSVLNKDGTWLCKSPWNNKDFEMACVPNDSMSPGR